MTIAGVFCRERVSAVDSAADCVRLPGTFIANGFPCVALRRRRFVTLCCASLLFSAFHSGAVTANMASANETTKAKS